MSSCTSSSPPTHRVTLYYDCLSPYAYLAFTVLTRYRSYWNIELVLTPIFQGAIMNETKNKPPALVPTKAVYMAIDLENLSRYFDVPLRYPSNVNDVFYKSVHFQRLVTAVLLYQPDKLEAVTRRVWQGAWEKDENILDQAVWLKVLKEVGLSEEEAKSVIERTTSAEVKEKLKVNTQEALEAGAFGVPTYVIEKLGKDGAGEGTKHMLFGSDRFHVAAQIMEKQFFGAYPPTHTKFNHYHRDNTLPAKL